MPSRSDRCSPCRWTAASTTARSGEGRFLAANPGSWTPTCRLRQTPVNVTGCDDQRIRFNPEIALQPTSPDAGAPTGLDVHLKVPHAMTTVENATDLYAQNGDVHGDRHPADEESRRHPAAGDDDLHLGGAGPRGLHARPRSGSAPTNRCNAPTTPATARSPSTPRCYRRMPRCRATSTSPSKTTTPSTTSSRCISSSTTPIAASWSRCRAGSTSTRSTGQITTTFDDLPQFPISDMQLTFKGGVRAALVNPRTCGTKTINADLLLLGGPRHAGHPVELLRRHPKAGRLALRQQPRRPPLRRELTAGTSIRTPAATPPSSSGSPAPTTTRSSARSASPCRRG